jgi:hypothetical protein
MLNSPMPLWALGDGQQSYVPHRSGIWPFFLVSCGAGAAPAEGLAFGGYRLGFLLIFAAQDLQLQWCLGGAKPRPHNLKRSCAKVLLLKVFPEGFSVSAHNPKGGSRLGGGGRIRNSAVF